MTYPLRTAQNDRPRTVHKYRLLKDVPSLNWPKVNEIPFISMIDQGSTQSYTESSREENVEDVEEITV